MNSYMGIGATAEKLASQRSVAVLCWERPLYEAIRTVLRDVVDVRLTISWPEFIFALPTAGCGLIAWDDKYSALHSSDSVALSTLSAHNALFIVTTPSVDSLVRVATLPPAVLIPVARLGTELKNSVVRACARTRRADVALALERATLLDPLVRTALAAAARNVPPIRDLLSLAKHCGCSRSTLWRKYRGSQLSAHSVRLEDLLDWIVLKRCLDLKHDRVSWQRVARSNGTTTSWIRAAKRRYAVWLGADGVGTRTALPPVWAQLAGISLRTEDDATF